MGNPDLYCDMPRNPVVQRKSRVKELSHFGPHRSIIHLSLVVARLSAIMLQYEIVKIRHFGPPFVTFTGIAPKSTLDETQVKVTAEWVDF